MDDRAGLGRPADGVFVWVNRLWRPGRTGIGTYGERMVEAVCEVVPVTVGGTVRAGDQPDGRYGGARVAERRGVAAVAARAGAGTVRPPHTEGRVVVTHKVNVANPARFRGPTAVTVFDLSPLDMPGEYSTRTRLMFRASIARLRSRAAVAICISEFTRERLIDRFPELEARSVAAPLGPTFGALGAAAPDGPVADPPVRTILFLGELTRRKRATLLIDAFVRAGLGSEWRLVIAGHPGNAADEVRAMVAGASAAGVVLVESPSDDEVLGLYRQASLLCLPSRLEGFGIPVLDAMSMGVPVVVADTGSLPEVVGSAGLVVDCTDATDLVSALKEVAGDEALRRQLASRGRARAQTFSWSAHAERCLVAYDIARDLQR